MMTCKKTTKTMTTMTFEKGWRMKMNTHARKELTVLRSCQPRMFLLVHKKTRIISQQESTCEKTSSLCQLCSSRTLSYQPWNLSMNSKSTIVLFSAIYHHQIAIASRDVSNIRSNITTTTRRSTNKLLADVSVVSA